MKSVIGQLHLLRSLMELSPSSSTMRPYLIPVRKLDEDGSNSHSFNYPRPSPSGVDDWVELNGVRHSGQHFFAESDVPKFHNVVLDGLIERVDEGLRLGISPTAANSCAGGVYFVRDRLRNIVGVFKPEDEEPYALNNPNGYAGFSVGQNGMKSGILAGEGAVREVLAHVIDWEGFSGVPVTGLVGGVDDEVWGRSEKRGSFQMYRRHLCTAEDMGPSIFPVEDVHRIAILDIRLANQDRHPGNILVCDAALFEADELHMKESEGVNSARDKCGIESEEDSGNMSRSWTSGVRKVRRPSAVPPQHSALPSVSPRLSTEERGATLRLVPIDHGMCLPRYDAMADTTFAWHYWRQAEAPLSEASLRYIEGLDAVRDEVALRASLGGRSPSASAIRTLHVCTSLLKKGVAAGLSLRRIADLMVRDEMSGFGEDGCALNPSPLEVAIAEADSAIGGDSQFHPAEACGDDSAYDMLDGCSVGGLGGCAGGGTKEGVLELLGDDETPHAMREEMEREKREVFMAALEPLLDQLVQEAVASMQPTPSRPHSLSLA